jgi:hypothetical protein
MMRMRALAALLVLAVAGGAFSTGCDDKEESPQVDQATVTPASTATITSTAPATPSPERATPTPTATPSAPRRVSYAPGATVPAQQGVYYVDPNTGAVEGWDLPELPTAGAFGITVSPGGRYIIWSVGERQVQRRLLDTRTGAVRDHPPYIRTGPFAPDDRRFLAQTTPPNGQIVRAEDGEVERTLSPPADGLWFFENGEWAPDGESLLLWFGAAPVPRPQQQRRVFRLNLRTGSMQEVAKGAILGASWAADGQRYALLHHDAIEMWRADTNAVLWRLTVQDLGVPPSAERFEQPFRVTGFSRDGGQLLFHFAGASGMPPNYVRRLYMVDAATGRVRFWLENALVCGPHVWSADGRWLHVLGLWQGQGGSLLVSPDSRAVQRVERGYVEDLSPVDGGTAGVKGGAGNELLVIDIPSGSVRHTIRFDGQPAWDFVHQPAWLTDGRIVVTAPHLGHGGCGEGPPLPEMEIRIP